MSELSGLGPELLAEVLAEAPEAARTVSYKQGETVINGITAIPDALKFGEADGEAVKITDSAWVVFGHQLTVAPHADDWLIQGTFKHYVIRAEAGDPAGITWRLITRG